MARRGPAFPPELFRGILSNLSHDKDRKTLLSASLASSALRDESQRVLFQSTTVDWWSTESKPIFGPFIRMHLLFLRSILASPNRLAKYVHTYMRYLNLSPLHTNEIKEIIDLTPEALRVMKNLKRLAIEEFISYPKISSSSQSSPSYRLDECNFQLEALEWSILDRVDVCRGPGVYNELVSRSQSKLLHICLGHRLLHDDMYPELKSVSISDTLSRREIYNMVRERKNMAILSCHWLQTLRSEELDIIDANMVAAFHQIRYLEISRLPRFDQPDILLSCVGKNVILLKVSEDMDAYMDQYAFADTVDVVKSSNFPALIVLVVEYYRRSTTATSFNKDTALARNFFNEFSHLSYIDFVYRGYGNFIRRYHRSQIGAASTRVAEKIAHGYSYYWWEPHVGGISDEIRYSVEP